MSQKKPRKASTPSKDPRKLPRQSRSQETLHAIFTATQQIIENLGPEALTTTTVAERAGVSIGFLYQYFPNREALISAFTEDLNQKESALVQSVLQEHAGRPLRETLEEVIRAYARYFAKRPKLQAFHSYAELALARQGEIRKQELGGVEMITQLLEQSGEISRKRDLQVVAFLITYTVLNALRFGTLTRPNYLGDPKFEEELVRLVLNYLE
jgi:AcrR family transcriptional regulator